MPKKALKTALKIKSGELKFISRRELKGSKNAEEREALILLNAWHDNAKKKQNFSGVLR